MKNYSKILTLFLILLTFTLSYAYGQMEGSGFDNGIFENLKKEAIEKDKLAKALKLEANKTEISFAIESKCSGVETQVKNVIDVNLPSDDILVVMAKGIPSSGYKWVLESVNNGLVDLEVENLGPSVVPGENAEWRFVLKGAGKGVDHLKFVYKRPWEDDAPLKEYLVNVTSEGEYTGNFTFKNDPLERVEAVVEESTNKALPSSFDWRSQGKVTSVKNQGSTSACWAFGTCASTESAILIAGGANRDLSEQYLCNCDASGSCSNGGWFAHWLFKDGNRGAVYESQVPFQYAGDYACGTYTYNEKISVWGWTDGIADTGWPQQSHNASNTQIKQAIYDYGPVAANCYSSCWANSAGIQNVNCTGGAHIVTIVGWNDASGGYWIVKNSWGTSWGDNGYLYLRYNTCEMGRYSTYVEMEGGTTTDTQAPTVPTNLQVTSTTSSSISLSWTASTDNIGVTGYTINNATDNENYTTTGTTYTVTGLTADKSYTFYVNAKDAAGNTSGWSTAATGKTDGGTTTGYCASKGSNVNYEWIAGVTVGSYNKSTGANGGYADFTNETVSVSNGTSVTLTPGFASSAYTEYWKIWIDVNKNEVFDSNEEVFSSSGNGAVSGTINLPSGSTGTTRMRVSMKYNAAPTACETLNYGEVEDYTVNMSGGTTTDTEAPTVPSNFSVSGVTSSSISLSWTASTDNVEVTSYTINNATDNENYTTSGTSYTVTGLTADKSYTFYVNAKDAAGNTSGWSSAAQGTTSGGTTTTYCAASNTSGPEHIARVVFGSINNSSSRDNYHDYTGISTNVTRGSSYSLTVTIGDVYSSGDYATAWIDWNGDGDFTDSGEEFDLSVSGANATASITVPTSASATSTRMRIRVHYYAADSEPCGDKQYGEVEDYTINISGSSSSSNGSMLSEHIVSFPNPFSSTATFRFDVQEMSYVKINVYNSAGILVGSLLGNNLDKGIHEIKYDGSELPSGIYLYNINIGDKTLSGSMIKE